MPFIPTPNALEAALKWDHHGIEVCMVLHFGFSGAPGATERANLATAMHTWWTNQLKPFVCPPYLLKEIDIRDLSSSAAPVTVLSVSPFEAGTSAGSPSPSNVALVVTHRTAARGRSYRGRSYVFGWSGGVLTNEDIVSTGFVGSILGAFDWLRTPVNVAAGIWSVLSRFTANNPRSQGVMTPITAVSADTIVDSQRRRLPGRGA